MVGSVEVHPRPNGNARSDWQNGRCLAFVYAASMPVDLQDFVIFSSGCNRACQQHGSNVSNRRRVLDCRAAHGEKATQSGLAKDLTDNHQGNAVYTWASICVICFKIVAMVHCNAMQPIEA